MAAFFINIWSSPGLQLLSKLPYVTLRSCYLACCTFNLLPAMADTWEVVCAIYLPLVQSWVTTPVRVTLCNSRSCYLARCTQIFEGQNFQVFYGF